MLHTKYTDGQYAIMNGIAIAFILTILVLLVYIIFKIVKFFKKTNGNISSKKINYIDEQIDVIENYEKEFSEQLRLDWTNGGSLKSISDIAKERGNAGEKITNDILDEIKFLKHSPNEKNIFIKSENNLTYEFDRMYILHDAILIVETKMLNADIFQNSEAKFVIKYDESKKYRRSYISTLDRKKEMLRDTFNISRNTRIHSLLIFVDPNNYKSYCEKNIKNHTTLFLKKTSQSSIKNFKDNIDRLINRYKSESNNGRVSAIDAKLQDRITEHVNNNKITLEEHISIWRSKFDNDKNNIRM